MKYFKTYSQLKESINESKIKKGSDIVKIMSNPIEWGSDMKDRVFTKGNNFIFADTFYYGQQKALDNLIKSWSLGGNYYEYFKDNYGVELEVVASFSDLKAKGKFKKLTDDGVVYVELAIENVNESVEFLAEMNMMLPNISNVDHTRIVKWMGQNYDYPRQYDIKRKGKDLEIIIKKMSSQEIEDLKYHLKSQNYINEGKSLLERISQEAVYIHSITGSGQDGAQNFIDDNGIDAKKLADYVRLHRNSKEKYDVRDIIAGTGVGANKSFVKRFIKQFKESLDESVDTEYAVMLTGGSIGDKPRPRDAKGYVGLSIGDEEVYTLDKAKEKAKRMNKALSPGEKGYYKLKYVVVPVANGKFIKESRINEEYDVSGISRADLNSILNYLDANDVSYDFNGREEMLDFDMTELDKKGQAELKKLGISESLNEREYSNDQRTDMADKGLALPDGSFPIKDLEDLKNAIQAYGRSKDQSAAAKFIAKRAKELSAEDLIPDTEDFQKSLKETLEEPNAFLSAHAKAIKEEAEEFEFNGKTYPVLNRSKKINEASKIDVKDIKVGSILNFNDGEQWKVTKFIGNPSNPRGVFALPHGDTKKNYVSVALEFTIGDLEQKVDSLNEATTSWAKLMKGVKSSETGPWSLVAIDNKKVVGQKIDIRTSDIIPAHYEATRKEFPKAKIHVEDGTGAVVWTSN